ncbi:hypothetical protein FW774_00300 (plasmid) [Pedobacter sp. BS3]|uniref:hypothetical protein n=1 Tax=Pedobacter sp. BS3 TaxID=2567937 RepID=UPI0011EC3C8D|nr:hypothetical protein [Pedobacter sp. BS3]TZF85559.1 hypothetical protein FW774_00300 [Pedobacter sp. BS3]
MKKILFSILCCPAFMLFVKAQVYTYPIQSGTENWKKLKSHSEMLKATKLPMEYLNVQSADLLQSCLSYPLLFDYTAYNNPYYGFKKVVLQSNVLSEFMKRKDNGMALLNYYKSVDINSINLLKNEIEQGNLTLTLTAVEFMMSDSTALRSLSKDKRTELMDYLKDVIILKEKNVHTFGTNGIISSLFLASRILDLSGNAEWKEFCIRNESIVTFMNNYVPNKELISNIQAFITQLKN